MVSVDTVRTLFLTVWFVFALLLSGFILWRKLRRERVDFEDKLMDRAILSVIVGLVVGRVVFIILNFSLFGIDLGKWLSVQFPQGIEIASLATGFLVFYGSLGKDWKDALEIVDYVSIALAFLFAILFWGDFLSQVFLFVNTFFIHQASIQLVTDYRPIVIACLYTLLFFVLFVFLSHVEKTYRTFLWYRAKRRSAQTGFVLASFLIGYGLFGFLLGWFQPMSVVILGVGVDPILKLLVVMLGFVILYVRSGRSFFRRV